ncbi:hypothetical protein [Algihabitans albus]|uniref:hypothetical protein n=1 Tax=Algihabitans albus TaxID=2164067 RepID=UPI0013C31487|nr:hypothetical protein [Algihabitans albus]
MAKTWTNNREPRLEDLLEDELTWKLLEVSGSTVEELRREMTDARSRLKARTQARAA